MPMSDDVSNTTNESVTLQEFETMAKRGRIHMTTEDLVEPSKRDRNRAKSPVDLGRLRIHLRSQVCALPFVKTASYKMKGPAIQMRGYPTPSALNTASVASA
jgi:hypothetical protein